MIIGYARVSTRLKQDPRMQIDALLAMGIPRDRIYVDHGFTGKNRNRPDLAKALAAIREGDTLAVTKLDRLARSVMDAHELAKEITGKGAKLRIADAVHDPLDPTGKLLFNVLAMIAEFERDLISMRTRDGLVQAVKDGRMKGGRPKLAVSLEREMIRAYATDERTVADIARSYGVTRATVYRAIKRAGGIDAVVGK
jgi:DNA invertase Pin-like site-specific DNA recombinase